MIGRGRSSVWVWGLLKPSYPTGLHEMKREGSGKSKREEEGEEEEEGLTEEEGR